MFEGKPTEDGQILIWLKPRLTRWQRFEGWLLKWLARLVWLLLGFCLGWLAAGITL